MTPPFLVFGFPLLLSASSPSTPPAGDAELRAAVACVISAWNAYDVDASRKCYTDSAVSVTGGERTSIDWAFERRLREFDAAAGSRFEFDISDSRGSSVRFTLRETNALLGALGLEQITARWRYDVRDGRVAEEHLLEGDGAFRSALQELATWARVERPRAWAAITGPDGHLRFDGTTAPALVALAREWSDSRSAGGEGETTGDTRGEIMKLERELARAAVAIDVEAIRRIEAETYVYTDARGKASTREDFIRAYQNGEGRVRSLEYDELTVDAYGDAAVVRGRLRVERQDGDKTLTRTARYTRFYVRRDGRWQAVAGHSSEIPSEKK